MTERDSYVFGFAISPDSFDYLNEFRRDEELPEITRVQICEGLEKALTAYENNDSALKQQFFEWVLDLTENCIEDEAAEKSNCPHGNAHCIDGWCVIGFPKDQQFPCPSCSDVTISPSRPGTAKYELDTGDDDGQDD